MLITRLNPLTNKEVTLDIPVNEKDLLAWERGEGLIQDLMPYLSTDDREFIMTGLTTESWNELFKKD